MWLAAETQTETANSERSGITPPDSRGWSSSVTRGVGSHYPLGLGDRRRKASRSARKCDLTTPLSPKKGGQTHACSVYDTHADCTQAARHKLNSAYTHVVSLTHSLTH